MSAVFRRCFEFENLHWSVWNDQQMEIFKIAKVTFDFMVTMATVYIKELWNVHQKIPHKILGKVMKFWLLSPSRSKVILKKPWGAPPQDR